ncbi:D-alanyl-D-alanine carboxypeptidase family protein [Mesorhizobium sp. YM1C-6-2]|uniref:D-alanyl-D-alanine carboxypeptidase n=1 Tax=Mesorhizobium sp. YM1C-6-2 TaxID=1827501 RepID=UPI001FE188E2|nr:D-alanyl-D-alanine carboxypeptidase family protein [Mesorhizobium sp. YM1C-6-2]
MRQLLTGIARRTISSCKLTLAALAALGITSATVPSAQANSKYAAIVVDANTGKTLFSSSADAARYPASLTKMMTLYLTFEALESGRLKTSSKVRFSKNAAAEPPTKLGVKAGGSITVETAILSLVTKSANDSATALAELLGGSEAGFARMMTAKARQLGMTGTIFRNAHGLPNPAQHTTARDMATLGIALHEHFPQYYDYFSTRSFTYGKQRLANHNRLLGRIKGVDGIKTGYTRASGFNLASSVSDGNRRIVAVVLGGQTGKSRDNHMAELIRTWLPKASTRRGSGDLVAKAGAASNSPIRALTALLPGAKEAPRPKPRPEEELTAFADTEEAEVVEQGDAEPDLVEQAYAAPIPARMADIDPISTAAVPKSGWSIQVASSPSEVEARAFLTRTTRQAGDALADASPYTMTFEKGGVTYYRARFGGFQNKGDAWDACKALKRKKIECYAVEQ